MKLTKKNQGALIALFALASLLGVFVIAQSVVMQICGGLQVAGEEHSNSIGIMETVNYQPGCKGSEKLQPIVVIEGSESEPEILAKPVEVLLYSEAENFTRPDHWGFTAFKWNFYFRSALLIALIVLLICFGWNTLRGARSGNIFNRSNLGILYALSPISFLYLLANDNVYMFKQLAISDLYADRASIDIVGEFTINAETLVVPLLLVTVAMLYKVAIVMNEDEVMTV